MKINKEQFIQEIQKKLNQQASLIIAIDGRCASGKTTAATELSQIFNAPIIHLDDFFLRPEQRTPQRYQQPGGNVDYERLVEEVFEPLITHENFYYRPFDCQTMTLQQPVLFEQNRLVIIEGSYSMRPEFRKYYDLTCFFDVDAVEQLKRIEIRNPDKVNMFVEKWIPYEEKYFTHFDIRNYCDFIVETTTIAKNIVE